MPARQPTNHSENGTGEPRAEQQEPSVPNPVADAPVQAPRRVSGEPGQGFGPSADIPRPLTFDQLMERQMDEPEVLVDGVLHQGSKMVISGGSKSYKTWMLLDLALSVATGTEWLGKPTKRGKVLFVNFELQDYFFRKRVLEVMEAKGITAEHIRDTFYYVGLRGINTGNASTLIETLQARTAGIDLKMIILDPLYKMHGDRDENSAGDMADLMSYLDKLARNTKAAVVFGHHFSKGNQASKDMRDRGAGSGAIMRDADSIMTVTPHTDEDSFIVECVPRNFPPWKSFVVRRQHPLMVVDDEADAGQFRRVNNAGRPPIQPDNEVLALLDAGPLTKAEWKNAMMSQLGMTQSPAYRRIEELLEEGAVALENGHYQRAPRTSNGVQGGGHQQG